jgi:DMSO/TMAO reductase YedYZ heme-binding membrane subunit
VTHLLWYLNRGSGVILVAVLTLATALGVLSTSTGGSRRWPRFALQALHRNLSLLACVLLLGHAVTPVLDWYVNHYAPMGWLDVVVPFVAGYKPFGMGLGTIAFDLIAVAALSSLARQRFTHRTWFRLHLLTYAAWVLGVVHGLLIGTDARTPWGLAVTTASVAVVAAAVVWRLTGLRSSSAGRAVAVPASSDRGRRRAGRRAAA